jgi:hypothetical protein
MGNMLKRVRTIHEGTPMLGPDISDLIVGFCRYYRKLCKVDRAVIYDDPKLLIHREFYIRSTLENAVAGRMESSQIFD